MLISILVDLLNFATPLLIAATGILIVEKSGVLNLGVEGLMIVGALSGYMVAGQLHSCAAPSFAGGCLMGGIVPLWAYGTALLAAGLVGAAFSCLFALLVLILRANQIATGLGLSILGLSLTNAIGSGGYDLSGVPLAGLVPAEWIAASDLRRLAAMNMLTFMSLALLPLMLWFLSRTRAGLILRAVGENHGSAHTLGYPVRRLRFFAVLFGGFMCAVAGAYMALALNAPSWREGITNGFGWLALALILFGTWRPLRVLLGGLLFGLTISLGPRVQLIDGLPGWVDTLLLPGLPYILPIIVLALISWDANMIRRNQPGSLGQSFNT